MKKVYYINQISTNEEEFEMRTRPSVIQVHNADSKKEFKERIKVTDSYRQIRTKKKSRAVILNPREEVLVAYFAGLYKFPGGGIENNETDLEALEREIREETGLDGTIKLQADNPFLQVQSYNENYRSCSGVCSNKKTVTNYYIMNTDTETIDASKQHLEDYEIQKGFKVKFLSLMDLKADIELYIQRLTRDDLILKEDYEKGILYDQQAYQQFIDAKIKMIDSANEILEVIKAIEERKIYEITLMSNQR